MGRRIPKENAYTQQLHGSLLFASMSKNDEKKN